MPSDIWFAKATFLWREETALLHWLAAAHSFMKNPIKWHTRIPLFEFDRTRRPFFRAICEAYGRLVSPVHSLNMWLVRRLVSTR